MRTLFIIDSSGKFKSVLEVSVEKMTLKRVMGSIPLCC